MRRAALAAAAILVAVTVQVTVLNRLPFPGGSGPDLVLVLVASIALATGPLEGALTGFAAGLALGVAPPGSAMLGLSALVFCLVGYGAGKLRAPLERSALLPLSAVAASVVAGEILYALVGMIFGDSDITWHAVRYVLPSALVYDLLLSPFVLYGVVRLGRLGEWQSGRARDGMLTGRELTGRELAGSGLAAPGLVGAAMFAGGSVVRDTGTGRSPRLRAAAARRSDGWIGGHHGQQTGARPSRQRPLRLRGGVAGSAAAGQVRPAAPPAPPVHVRFGSSSRRDGTVNGFSRGRPAAGRRPGATRLKGGAFRGGPSALSGKGRTGPSRTPRLRLRHGRRGDGLVGGGALRAGRVPSGASGSARRGIPAAAFHAGRAPGAAGTLRPGRAGGATPRFRVTGRGLSGWAGHWVGKGRQGKGGPGARGHWPRTRRGWARRLGRRGGWTGGLAVRDGWANGLSGLGDGLGVGRARPARLSRRRGWPRLRRSGLGAGRVGPARLGAGRVGVGRLSLRRVGSAGLGGRRWLGGRRGLGGHGGWLVRRRGGVSGLNGRRWPRRSGPGRRPAGWKVGSKGTGGLP